MRSSDEPGYLGPYRLLERLGDGAMGQVYRAEHVGLGREVAIKLLRKELSSDHDHVQRLFAEARAANRVQSEHIIEVTDLCFTPNGEAYLVMELLRGRDFATARARGELGLLASLRILRQLTETMAKVHAAGIVHRDLKPENVFVTERDGQPFVKLIDFGVAKLMDGEGRSLTHTLPGLLVGTPRYMAPEQAGASPVDERCDVYAIGVMLFEVLTGTLPFDADTLRSLLMDIAVKDPPRVSERTSLPASIRGAADRLVAACLSKDPDCRPSAAELVSALDSLISNLASASEIDGRSIIVDQVSQRHLSTLRLRPSQLAQPSQRYRAVLTFLLVVGAVLAGVSWAQELAWFRSGSAVAGGVAEGAPARQAGHGADTADAAAEFALLQRARRRLPVAPSETLSLVEDHERRFAGGMFVREREVLAIEALIAKGLRGKARARAARFRKAHPTSAHLARIEQLLGSP